MSPSRVGRLAALTAVIAMLIFSAPSVKAEPTLSLNDLGGGATLSFYGDTSSTSLSFPVPVGLFPTSLNTTVVLPFNIRSGILTVTQDDRLITKLGLPLTDGAPLVIPLGGVEIVDQSVDLTLALASRAEDGFCLDTLHPIEFANTSVTYDGREIAPQTVADFLPPILSTATIAVPREPSEAESEAAVQLATVLTTRYRGQNTQTALVPLADGAAALGGVPEPMERRIVIKEGPDDGISLSGAPATPDLLISGPADKLTTYTRLFIDGSLDMAVSTKVIPEDLPLVDPPPPGDSTTLTQLGQPALTATAVAPQVSIGLDQTRFGSPTQGFRVHLLGSYTPVPADFGSQMTASVGGEVITSWPTNAEGAIDQWVDIPDRLLQRSTSLVVEVETSGNTGSCDEFRPIKLSIYGSSTVESSPAQSPNPTGFRSLPQALMPRVQFGISMNSVADTVRAVQIAVGLQRLSAVPLSVDLKPLEQAVGGDDPAVLISPDGWTDASIALPVSSKDNRLDLVGFNPGDEETTLILDPGIQFGSLQTVFEGKRTLLIATSNGAAPELDRLLEWLTADPKRWSTLRGAAVVAIPGRPPEMVPGRAPLAVYGPPTSPAAQNASDSRDGISPWWAAAGVGAALIIAVAAFRLGIRRARPRSGGPVEDGGHQS
ncbi:hypothetical protein ACIA48_17595 [Mycobacterium sp. NPDC051804]|uniref:hypothetical protein n=1 Tax=Mycobacterium sp. NPDC051804 TaxID=3364295 RepID=UPI00379DA015